jgi:hypothetical protein
MSPGGSLTTCKWLGVGGPDGDCYSVRVTVWKQAPLLHVPAVLSLPQLLRSRPEKPKNPQNAIFL